MTLSRAGSRSQSEPSTESLADALTALCAEVGIPFEEMLHTVESALAVAYISAFNPPGDVRVILDAQRNTRQAQVRVSRAARMFVHRLMEAEVPEIKAGTVQVRAIAREPGLRTKVAVSATEPGIDPVGACVGPKGVRHRAILSELANEHVDIVPWSDDPEVFVASSLGPAKADSVTIDRGTRTATVLVPKAQLSLAIG